MSQEFKQHIHHLDVAGTHCKGCGSAAPVEIIDRRKRVLAGNADAADYVGAVVAALRDGSAVRKGDRILMDGDLLNLTPATVALCAQLAEEQGQGIRCDGKAVVS